MKHVVATLACLWVLWNLSPSTARLGDWSYLDAFETKAECVAQIKRIEQLIKTGQRGPGAVFCFPAGLHPRDTQYGQH
jgi:hypothetical protein